MRQTVRGEPCNRIVARWLAAVTTLLIAFPLYAQNGESANALVSSGKSSKGLPLHQLRAESGPIRLDGTQNSATVTFPISARESLSEVELSLYVTNSIALMRRSQMAVSINGSVIGQIPFKSEHPESHTRIAIPSTLLSTGYNQLTFSVAQHYTESCEDPAAPELWSEIDTMRSVIRYNALPRTITPSLAQLPLLMDKRLSGDYSLTIATVNLPDNALIEAGAFVAQAAALSREYAALTIDHATLTKPEGVASERRALDDLPDDIFGGGDGVLLGTRDELQPWLDNTIYAKASEPLLALRPYGREGNRFVLIVTGMDSGEVRLAAKTLMLAYEGLPPTDLSNVGEMVAGVATRSTLHSGKRQSFAELGFESVTRQGIYPEPMRLRFWVPADRFAKPNSELNLHLHMAYGAGAAGASTLNIFLNNRFEHAIALMEPVGAVYYDYRIPIPISSLAPGWNDLTFRPNMLPQRSGGECQAVFTNNLLLTLFDDSYLQTDEMGQLVQLPDLNLLARTGFPFTGGREQGGLTVMLTENSSGNVAAAWSLLGKLAQVNHYPITKLSVSGMEGVEGEALLLGQFDDVPVLLKQASALGREGWIELGNRRGRGNVLDNLFAADAAKDKSAGLEVSLGDLMQRGLVVTQFENPLSTESASVVMVVAATAELLRSQVASLVEDAYWRQLGGGTVVYTEGAEQLLKYPAAANYLVGDAGAQARISYTFIHYPLLALAIIGAVILLFSLLTLRWLISYRRRRSATQDF
ncbi:MAG: cellulose biosynthesis cyclic di-GMP-binding regulatory protein BcsB [Chromatiales bacterium]|nr:cellulose biosynthesis cyclic di-GMP-binding regulatory protein BcsB [Chromatiales bacterium]